MIRLATENDIPKLLEMGERFSELLSAYPGGYSAESVENMLRHCLSSGVVLVADTDGKIEGFVLGVLSVVWHTGLLIAAELALWINPDKRGGVLVYKLLHAFEEWAANKGARCLSVSDFSIGGRFPVRALYERAGYKLVEQIYVKEAGE